MDQIMEGRGRTKGGSEGQIRGDDDDDDDVIISSSTMCE